MVNNKIKIAYITGMVFILMLISSGVRYYQLYEWKINHPEYFSDKFIPLTTLDGYYWIRLAKMADNLSDMPDIYRGYPDHPYSIKMEADNLFVFLINKLNKFIGNYYITGIYLVIFLSSLFIIPLFLYFYSSAGISTAIMGSVLTTFGYSYFYRTFLGRVDTDCMTLFFPLMLSYLIYTIPKADGYKKYILAILTGIFGYLFMWWYKYPGFILIYSAIIFTYLLFKKEGFVKSTTITVLFVIFSNPLYFISGLDSIKYFIFGSKYFAGEGIKENSIIWPNIAEFISETQKQGYETILLYAAGGTYIGILGLIGVILLIIKMKKDFIPLLPVFMLGIISFKSGNRFTMYLSPFIYSGLGYLIYFFVEYFFKNVVKIFDYHLKFFSEIASGIIAVFSTIFITVYFSGIFYKPTPSIPASFHKTASELRNILGERAVVVTWWDFGYMYQDVSNVSTFHDGGIQGKSRGYFIGLGFTSDSQHLLYNIVSYFDNNGFKIFEENKNTDVKKVIDEIKSYKQPVKNKNIYIIVSYDMVYKYDGMAFFGKWDFDKKISNYTDYEKKRCYIEGEDISCDGEKLNKEEGVLGEEQLSRLIIFDENGVKKDIDYGVEGRILQIVLSNNKVFISYLLDDEIFNSNFNQLYFFGKYDNNLFEKIYDNFPIMRVYRIRG
ncbi:MAG: hypothetical protein LDL13_04200 [Calditerrivibrio sp.]|nr:hypothetical protein [Calditerrivibrio sp.]